MDGLFKVVDTATQYAWARYSQEPDPKRSEQFAKVYEELANIRERVQKMRDGRPS